MAMSKNQFNEKMIEVAKILGMTWEENPERRYDNCGYLKGTDDHKLWVLNGGYQTTTRIYISGQYPSDSKGHRYSSPENRVEMSVSENKTAEQIGKDIERRLLPKYLTAMATLTAQIKSANQYYAARQKNIGMIAKEFGWELRGQDKDVIYPDVPGIYKIEALNDCLIKFTVEGSPELAIQIIELLQEKGRT